MTLETRNWKLETGRKSETRKFLGISSFQSQASRLQGFTLIEALVAVTILTLSIAGPLMVANRAIVAAQMSRQQLTASYLAQEGIEYVRAMRDDAYLAAYQAGNTSVAWNNFLSQCSGSACVPPLVADAFGNFTRSVEVVSVSSTDVRVTSLASWSFHGAIHSVTIYDHLTPWQ